MKYGFFCIPILAIAIAVGVWAESQYSGPLYAKGEMMSEIMRGGTAYAAQANGQAASKTYSSLCASCHGATGKGDGPASAALNPKPRDFADCKTMEKIQDDTLFKAIHDGGQSVGLSPMMPPWGGSLSEAQIHDLVRHIRGFCKK